ncbi:MAG: adenylyl-sulfate kinase [Promethearchaeota archaeon]
MVVNKNFIICLAGLPASGKTTFANVLKIKIEQEFNTEKVIVIDPDMIRKLLTPNNFDYKSEPKVREKNLTEIKEKLREGFIVISDDLNYYTSMRHDLKKISDEFKIKFFIINISTPLEICIKWNDLRGKPIPNKIIRKINRKFDNFGKYHWDNPEIAYDMSEIQDLNKEIENLVQILKSKVRISKKILVKEHEVKNFFKKDNEKLDKITRDYAGRLLQDSNLLSMKNKIIKLRKSFIKLQKNRPLKVNEIGNAFKDYLEKKLNIIITDNFF